MGIEQKCLHGIEPKYCNCYPSGDPNEKIKAVACFYVDEIPCVDVNDEDKWLYDATVDALRIASASHSPPQADKLPEGVTVDARMDNLVKMLIVAYDNLEKTAPMPDKYFYKIWKGTVEELRRAIATGMEGK